MKLIIAGLALTLTLAACRAPAWMRPEPSPIDRQGRSRGPVIHPADVQNFPGPTTGA